MEVLHSINEHQRGGAFKVPMSADSQHWRAAYPSFFNGLPQRTEMTSKEVETPPSLDSGYTSASQTRGPTRGNSRAGSPTRALWQPFETPLLNRSADQSARMTRCSSTQSSRACSPTRSVNFTTSCASSVATSPTKVRKAFRSEGTLSKSAGESNVFVMTLPSGQSVPLDDRSAASFLRNVMQSEVEAAKEWLDKMDWESAERYENMQYQCFVMEEEYKKVYSQPAPIPDFDEKTFQELVIADTVISMIEKALPEVQSMDSYRSRLLSEYTPTAQTPDRDLRRTVGSDSKRPSQIGSVGRKSPILEVDESADNLKASESGSSGSSKPMQVHRRSSKPKREDAVFNIRYKTQPCMHYQKHRKCPAGDNCHFAHGPDELRHARDHPKFKTQPCVHYAKNGVCPFESTCFFLHGTERS